VYCENKTEAQTAIYPENITSRIRLVQVTRGDYSRGDYSWGD